MADLREELQSALGGAYTVERELGGGGMSRVFLCTETALGRRVVMKTLPTDLGAGVNVERFRREIQLAAQLNHPHIVPVHAAGAAGAIPYYTMPLIEGESLRARLTRTGELSIPETVRYLREVMSALAYAHARHVVHRDIKPDNVLLSGEYALVTDFGVAKAIRESASGGSSLTSLGVALGTPAYMAPEQAAADPNVDARADLYAVGAMAYEMLTGQPPFAGRSPQMTLAAHVNEAPEAVARRRPNVPPVLGDLVMRLLEKRPADRPQSADEVLHALDALATPVSGTAPAMPAAQPVQRNVASGRAVVIYLGATVLVVALAWTATLVIGLPMWVVSGAIVVMALGAPVVAFSILAHSVPTPVPTPEGGSIPTAARLAARVRPYVTWKRVAFGGIAAMTLFLAFVAAFMVLRAMGIGPSASLLAAGVLTNRDKVLVTDFGAPASDTTIGTVVADALRTDLEQSRVVIVVEPAAVQEALQRMRRPARSRVDLPLAREIATREGIKAVVDGDVAALGSGFIASARLISAQSGEVLAAYRESANDANALIPAVDRLSRQLRAKIGESLRRVNGSPPLDRVSTVSLEALRKYSQGVRASEVERDDAKGIALLNAAIALDSNFAMAYRKLGMVYANQNGQPGLTSAMMRRAWELRAHLPEIERHLATASYLSTGAVYDRAGAIAEYEAALAIDPDNSIALNDVAILYDDARDHKRALESYARAVAVDSTFVFGYTNLSTEQFNIDDTAAAFATLRVLERREPTTPDIFDGRFLLYTAIHRYDSAQAQVEHLHVLRANRYARIRAGFDGSMLASVRGRLREASAAAMDATAADVELGNRLAPLDLAIAEAGRLTWFLGRPGEAVRVLDEAAKRYDVAAAPPLERRYLARAREYARAGRADRARALLSEFFAATPADQRGRSYELLRAQGELALAERRPDSAIVFFRRANDDWCEICMLAELARSYDLAGRSDSSIAVSERYLTFPEPFRIIADSYWLASTYKRLGELYEAKGNTERALSYYGKFVALWEHADPELQPQVTDVRKRITRLSARKG